MQIPQASDFIDPLEGTSAPSALDILPSEDAPLDGVTSKDKDNSQETREEWALHIGPLPSPEALRSYDEIKPGFGGELLDAFLEEGKHRRTLESDSMQLQRKALKLQSVLIKGNLRRSNWGLIAGFIFSMTAVSIGGWLAYEGHEFVGGIIAGSTVVSLTTVFVTGSLSRKSGQDQNGEKLIQDSNAEDSVD